MNSSNTSGKKKEIDAQFLAELEGVFVELRKLPRKQREIAEDALVAVARAFVEICSLNSTDQAA